MTAAPTLAERFFPDHPTHTHCIYTRGIILLTVWQLIETEPLIGLDFKAIESKLFLTCPTAFELWAIPEGGLEVHDYGNILRAYDAACNTFMPPSTVNLHTIVRSLDTELPVGYLENRVNYVHRLVRAAAEYFYTTVPIRTAP